MLTYRTECMKYTQDKHDTVSGAIHKNSKMNALWFYKCKSDKNR